MKISRQIGTASEIVNVFIQNATVSTGVGLANVSASSVSFSWCRNNQAAISSGTCSSNTVLGTYSTAALTQLSSTSSLGWYQLGAPNGVFASGGSAVLHLFGGPAAMAPVPMEIELTATNNQAILPVSVSTMSVTVGVSTIAVGEKLVGVSTIAVGEKLVGVSTIAAAQKLVGVSTLTTPVGVSSASVNIGVSTLATSVSSVTGPVSVSTMSVTVGVSTIAVGEKLVGVSTIAAAQKLVGVSTIATSVDVSSASVNLGVSTFATSVDVSSMSVTVGVSSSIMVSSNIVQVNGTTVTGDGSVATPWGPA